MTQETKAPETEQAISIPESTLETSPTPTPEAGEAVTPEVTPDELPADATPEQRQHWTQRLKAEAEAARAEAARISEEARAAKARADDQWAKARLEQKKAKEAQKKYDIDIGNPDGALLAEDPEYLGQFLQEVGEAAKVEAEAQTNMRRVYEGHVSRCEAFAQSTPDFAERVDSIRSDVGNALFQFVVESDIGPQIAYAVGTNPQTQNELASLLGNPVRFALRVGQIAAQAQAPSSPKQKAAPTLPPPVSSVTGNSGASPRQLSNDEYAKIREKQILEQAR